MSSAATHPVEDPHAVVLGHCTVLALTAGCVNSIALMIMATPVGNVTGLTTQLGMTTANPWLYEGHLLATVLLGFLLGAVIAGALLAPASRLLNRRYAIVLILEAILLLLAAASIEVKAFNQQAVAVGLDEIVVHAFAAAIALGLQNGLSSSFRGMSIRTTHFTGTVTDLGLMLGRSPQHGFDNWKAAILSSTLLLFLGGSVIGLLAGNQLGGWALVIPATTCLVLASVTWVTNRKSRRKSSAAMALDTPPPLT